MERECKGGRGYHKGSDGLLDGKKKKKKKGKNFARAELYLALFATFSSFLLRILRTLALAAMSCVNL